MKIDAKRHKGLITEEISRLFDILSYRQQKKGFIKKIRRDISILRGIYHGQDKKKRVSYKYDY